MTTVLHVKKQAVETRRTEILDTTCEVVIERGFAATRISDVAKRLDVSNSLIHYHFDSKESLLAEAFAHYARKDLAEMEAYIQAAPTATERLARLIQNYVPVGSDDLEWMLWIDAWGEALRNPLMKRISQELDDQSITLLQRVIDDGVASGEFSCPDSSASALRLTGLIDGLAVQYAAHRGVLTRESLLSTVTWLASTEVGADIPVDASDSGSVAAAVPFARGAVSVREEDIARVVHAVAARLGSSDSKAFAELLSDKPTWNHGGQESEGADAIWNTWSRSSGVFVVGLVSLQGQNGPTAHGVSVLEYLHRSAEGALERAIWRCEDEYSLQGGHWRLNQRDLTQI